MPYIKLEWFRTQDTPDDTYMKVSEDELHDIIVGDFAIDHAVDGIVSSGSYDGFDYEWSPMSLNFEPEEGDDVWG